MQAGSKTNSNEIKKTLNSNSFSNAGTNVDVELFVDGNISDQFKYRVRVLGAQFQYAKGKLSRPPGVQASVTELGANGLRFSFDAADVGWDGSSPLIIETVVVLPAPLGPSRPKISPLYISRSMPLTASNSVPSARRKLLRNPRTSTMVSIRGAPPL